MFGYILALVIGVILIGFCIAGMSRVRPGGDRRAGREGKPVQHEGPAAEEVTPDRSATASPGEIRAARGHTPPA